VWITALWATHRAGEKRTLASDRTVEALRSIVASARLRHKAGRRAGLLVVQAALRQYAETFEDDPAEFAARVLLEIDTALPHAGHDPHGSGPSQATSRVLARAAADLCLLVGD
jgi:hypothetical protein